MIKYYFIWLLFLPILGCGQSNATKCSTEAYNWYTEKVLEGDHDGAFKHLRKSYLCDTANAKIAFEYAQMSMEYGFFDTAINVLNGLLTKESLYPYIYMQISINHKNGSVDMNEHEFLKLGLMVVDGNESDFSYFIPKAIILYATNSPDSAVQYIERSRSLHTESYEEEIIADILSIMKDKSFDVEAYLFGKALPR